MPFTPFATTGPGLNFLVKVTFIASDTWLVWQLELLFKLFQHLQGSNQNWIGCCQIAGIAENKDTRIIVLFKYFWERDRLNLPFILIHLVQTKLSDYVKHVFVLLWCGLFFNNFLGSSSFLFGLRSLLSLLHFSISILSLTFLD